MTDGPTLPMLRDMTNKHGNKRPCLPSRQSQSLETASNAWRNMNISKSWALLPVLLCLSLHTPVRAESHAVSKTSTQIKTTNSTELKGSKQLVNNDNLIPTQNRTQAMAVESTTGHLPAGEDAMLTKQNAAIKKSTKTKSQSRKHVVHTRRGMSHAAIRRGVLEAARAR